MFVIEFPVNPKNVKVVRLIYLICNGETSSSWFDDGKFEAPENETNTIESACKRISLAAMMAQYFYWKTTGKTFRLEFDQQQENNRPIVHRFLVDRFDNDVLWQMNESKLWRLIANQLMNSPLASNDCKFLAFCSFSRYFPRSDEPFWIPSKQVKGYVSLGGDGLALLSTHCLYCWPEKIEEIHQRLNDQRPIDVKRFMNDSNNRNTRSGCFTTTFGAMIHELGHVFGLAHRQTGIMAREFNLIDEFFLHQNLSVNRWWTKEDLIILNLNPWFDYDLFSFTNHNNHDENVFIMNNDKVLTSKYGLRFVEYRHIETNFVSESKIFDEPIQTFKITAIEDYQKLSLLKLFVLDQNGNSKTFYL